MAKTRSQATPTKSGTPTKKAAKAAASSPSVKKTVTKKAAPAKKAAAATPTKKSAASPAKKETATAKKTATTTKATKITPAKKAASSSSEEIVKQAVVTKAISELSKFVEREAAAAAEKNDKKASLFDDADEEGSNDLFLQIVTKKFYSANVNLKPKQLKLTHSIKDRENLRTCLIIRDSLITTEEQLEKIEAENYETLKKIVSITDLKKEYKPYEKRRQLYSEYDLFLVDDACLNMLPQALGKVFYGNGSSNKAPLAVKVVSSTKPKEFSLDTFKNQLNKALQSTSFLPPVGVNVSVKFGAVKGELTDAQLAENVFDVLSAFKKEDLRSVSVKTSLSPSLPLYYTDVLHSEEDVKEVEDTKEKKSKKDIKEVKLSAFEKGLLELGDADEVAKIIGKKMNQSSKKKVTGKVGKPQKA